MVMVGKEEGEDESWSKLTLSPFLPSSSILLPLPFASFFKMSFTSVRPNSLFSSLQTDSIADAVSPLVQSDPIASLLETLRRAQDGAAASSSSSRQASSSQLTSSSQPYQPYQYPSSSSAPPADDEYDPAQPQLRQQPPPAPPSYRAPKAKVDLKALSFPQSLPYLAQLAEDPEFISKLNEVRPQLLLRSLRPSRDLPSELLPFQ